MKVEQIVPKRRHIKFRRQEITKKKAYRWPQVYVLDRAATGISPRDILYVQLGAKCTGPFEAIAPFLVWKYQDQQTFSVNSAVVHYLPNMKSKC